MGKLDQKVAVVTGAARGIGKQIALTFAREGANIVIPDLLEAEMEATAQEIRDLGREVIALKTDVSKKKEVERLIDTVINKFNKVPSPIGVMKKPTDISNLYSMIRADGQRTNQAIMFNHSIKPNSSQSTASQKPSQKLVSFKTQNPKTYLHLRNKGCFASDILGNSLNGDSLKQKIHVGVR